MSYERCSWDHHGTCTPVTPLLKAPPLASARILLIGGHCPRPRSIQWFQANHGLRVISDQRTSGFFPGLFGLGSYYYIIPAPSCEKLEPFGAKARLTRPMKFISVRTTLCNPFCLAKNDRYLGDFPEDLLVLPTSAYCSVLHQRPQFASGFTSFPLPPSCTELTPRYLWTLV